MMKTTNRFDPAAFEVPKTSPGGKSETSSKHKNAEVLVFSYLRVSLLIGVKHCVFDPVKSMLSS